MGEKLGAYRLPSGHRVYLWRKADSFRPGRFRYGFCCFDWEPPVYNFFSLQNLRRWLRISGI
jgi:hypothetical protein